MSQKLSAFALFVAIACGTSDRTAAAKHTVRDSAGVSILKHSAEFIAALPEWTIESVPLTQVREMSGVYSRCVVIHCW